MSRRHMIRTQGRHARNTFATVRHTRIAFIRARHARTLVASMTRLWACLLIISVLAATIGVSGVYSAAAHADNPVGGDATSSTSTATTTAGTCTESVSSLGGGTTDLAQADTGVATYVGKDMYVGGKPANLTDLENANGPSGTYAAEAEGLTIVNGKLAMKQIKNSWGGMGFRFGNVGYGTQFRPAANQTVLAVGRRNGKSVTLGSGSDAKQIAALAWPASDNTFQSDTNRGKHMNLGGGWVGFPSGGETQNMHYNIRIAGPSTYTWGFPGIQAPSLYQYDKNTLNSNGVGAISQLPDSQTNQFSQDFTVNGTDYSDFNARIGTMSADLADLAPTGNVSYDTAPRPNQHYRDSKHNYVIDYVKYKYDWFAQEVWNVNPVATYEYVFKDDSLNNEKLITFTGDGTSDLQVFDLPASALSTGQQYTGIDFWFRAIPKDASVVINVTGDQSIDFHNGWRFWWGGDQSTSDETFIAQAASSTTGVRDISNDYVRQNSTDSDLVTEYSQRAHQLLWNFTDTPSLTIRGGQAQGTQYQKASSGSYQLQKNGAMAVSDDPSATWMGSVLLPNGDFESHVTTAGRVYVGGDFQMYNPTPVAYTSASGKQVTFVNWEGGNSASAIDMDQVRYNLPWSGQITTQCSMLHWQVASDKSGNPLLGGSSWGVYASPDDARDGKNPITTVTDDGSNDWDSTPGVITLQGLTPKAVYYLRQLGAQGAYDVSPYIFGVTAAYTADTPNWVGYSLDENNSWSSTQGLVQIDGNPAIVNHYDPTISWKVVDDSDPSRTGVAGATWKVERLDSSGNVVEHWTVADNTRGSVSCNASTASCDADPSRGIVTLHTDSSGSTLADGTYRITQLTAGNGFVADGTQYTCALTGGIATWSGHNADETLTIGNSRVGGTATWKVTNTSKDALGDSQWTITQTSAVRYDANTGMYAYQSIDADARHAIAVVDCADGQSGNAASTDGCTATGTGVLTDADHERGSLTVDSLDWGTYEIRQTATAKGYHTDTRVATITVGPSGTDAINADSGFKALTTAADAGTWVDTSDVLLPYAGGSGGHWPVALIALVAGNAALLLAVTIRLRGRRHA